FRNDSTASIMIASTFDVVTGLSIGRRNLRNVDIFATMCFFFNDTAPTKIYTLSLHDALPISSKCPTDEKWRGCSGPARSRCPERDRKSTRLNSSHDQISYAVFCLKKKNPDNLTENSKQEVSALQAMVGVKVEMRKDESEKLTP